MKQKTMTLTAAVVLLLCFLSIPVLLLTQRADPVRDYIDATEDGRMLLEDEDGTFWLSRFSEEDMRATYGDERVEQAAKERDKDLFWHWLPVEGEPVRDEAITMELGEVTFSERDGLPWLPWRIENHLSISLKEQKFALLQVLLGEKWYPAPISYSGTLEFPGRIQPGEEYSRDVPLYTEENLSDPKGKPLPFGRYRLVWESDGHGQAVEFTINGRWEIDNVQ